MNIVDRFKEFDKNHNESKDNILAALNSEHEWDKEFCQIANWLLTNDHNPYGYLPESWAGCLSTATGTDSLLSHLHHAMVDDGDVSFIRVETAIVEYKIVFINIWDLMDDPSLINKGEYSDQKRYVGAKITQYKNPMEWVKDYEFSEEEWKRAFSEFDERMKEYRESKKTCQSV